MLKGVGVLSGLLNRDIVHLPLTLAQGHSMGKMGPSVEIGGSFHLLLALVVVNEYRFDPYFDSLS